MGNDERGVGMRGFRVGIDLGTTNSLVAHVGPGGGVEILPSRDQEPITPSVISLPRRRKGDEGQPGGYLVGRQAANNAQREPKNTVRSIKRFIGLPFADPRVQVAREHVAYEIQAEPGAQGGVVVKVGENLLTPEEVSALIMRQLKEDAEARLGGPVTHAVITVPAHFEEHRRAATRRAGALAGLIVLAILNEPTAAAISESEGEQDNARILVFDFGGGTLDISLVVRSRGNLAVRNYAGDNFLGGDDIDRGLADLIRERIVEQGGEIGRLRPEDRAKLDILLGIEAEKAKRALAGGLEADVSIAGVCRRADGEYLDFETQITPEDFAAVLAPLLARVRNLMKKFLESESLEPRLITEVLMVGGSSAVTPFRTLLQEIFEGDGVKRVKLARSPMEAIAKGAGIYASRLQSLTCPKCGEANDLDAARCASASCGAELALAAVEMKGKDTGGGQITEVLPRSLGVGYRFGDDRDAYQVILKKGSLYPTREPVSHSFRIPATERFQVFIREGDSEKASHNALIGLLPVEEIPPDIRRGDPVVVSFSYTRDRTLYISLAFPTSKSKFSPRWKLTPPADGIGESPDDPLRALTDVLPRARGFVNDYADYMDAGARKVFNENLSRAQQAVLDGNREEAARLEQALKASIFQGCGTASTLFLAENTIANEDETLGKVIRETAAKLRAQHERRDPAFEETRNALDRAILTALKRHRSGPSAEAIDDDTIYR